MGIFATASPAVPLRGTQELFTKVVTGIKLELSSTFGGLFNKASRDSKESGRFRFFGHVLNCAHDPITDEMGTFRQLTRGMNKRRTS
jgi:hypothetical protein